MRAPITAEEARAMANKNQNQFVNTRTMKKMLRFIKRKASQGYYSGVKKVFAHEAELIRVNLEKLGYKAKIEREYLNDEYYIRVAW